MVRDQILDKTDKNKLLSLRKSLLVLNQEKGSVEIQNAAKPANASNNLISFKLVVEPNAEVNLSSRFVVSKEGSKDKSRTLGTSFLLWGNKAFKVFKT